MSHGSRMVLVCARCEFETLETVGAIQAGDECPRCKAGRVKAGRFADTKDLDRLSPTAARPYESRAVLDLKD